MPPLDPSNITDYAKLKTAIDASVSKKRKREQQRLRLLKKLVGPYYGDDGCEERRPINMIEVGVDVLQRGLASHMPQAMFSTEYDELQATAADFETVVNRRLERIKLQQSLNICAIESLFTMGVMCIGLELDDYSDETLMFARPVLFPDLVLDMNAKSWEEQTYIGHDFQVPFDKIKETELFEGKGRDRFVRVRDIQYANRSSNTDWQRHGEDFMDMIWLRQLWLPHLNRVIICDPGGPMRDPITRIPLMSNEWEGPGQGPYRNLQFGVIPGHLFPKAPVPYWNDLDYVINRAYLKAAEQADRSKVVGLTKDRDDAAVIMELNDGQIGAVKDPDAVVEKKFGGADQQLLGMIEWSKVILNEIGGNWYSMAGLAPQSGTVGQDQLLSQAAAGRMKDMQKAMIEFETNVISDIAYWTWQDPLIDEPFFKQLEGTPYGQFGRWSPESRNGEFYQYNIKCNPYARVTRSPTEQAAKLGEILERYVLPAIPYMTAESPVDWEYLFRLLARYENAPELHQLLRFPGGGSIPEKTPETPTKQANTTRRYIRENRPSSTSTGRSKVLMNTFFGGNSQESEQAAALQSA